MSMNKTDVPPWVCDFFDELILHEHKKIAQRLIERPEEMRVVYSEIAKKVSYSVGRDEILAAILDSAAFFNKKNTKAMRDDLKRLNEVQGDIVKLSKKLIKLLNSHEQIQGPGFVGSGARTGLLYLIKETGKDNSRFERWLTPHIEKAQYSHSWRQPNLQKLLGILIREMDNQAELQSCGILLKTVLNSQKPSDMCKSQVPPGQSVALRR